MYRFETAKFVVSPFLGFLETSVPLEKRDSTADLDSAVKLPLTPYPYLLSKCSSLHDMFINTSCHVNNLLRDSFSKSHN